VNVKEFSIKSLLRLVRHADQHFVDLLQIGDLSSGNNHALAIDISDMLWDHDDKSP
jgi:hypothetical protein